MSWETTNIKIFRNHWCNDTKNDHVFIGWCKINRVQYEIHLWFLLDKKEDKFLSGNIYLKSNLRQKKGTIVLFQNKIKTNDKQPSMNGEILIFDGNEKHKVTLWYKIVKERKTFTGFTKYIEQEMEKKKQNTKIDFLEKIKDINNG